MTDIMDDFRNDPNRRLSKEDLQLLHEAYSDAEMEDAKKAALETDIMLNVGVTPVEYAKNLLLDYEVLPDTGLYLHDYMDYEQLAYDLVQSGFLIECKSGVILDLDNGNRK